MSNSLISLYIYFAPSLTFDEYSFCIKELVQIPVSRQQEPLKQPLDNPKPSKTANKLTDDTSLNGLGPQPRNVLVYLEKSSL